MVSSVTVQISEAGLYVTKPTPFGFMYLYNKHVDLHTPLAPDSGAVCLWYREVSKKTL